MDSEARQGFLLAARLCHLRQMMPLGAGGDSGRVLCQVLAENTPRTDGGTIPAQIGRVAVVTAQPCRRHRPAWGPAGHAMVRREEVGGQLVTRAGTLAARG